MKYKLYLRNNRGTFIKGEYDDIRHALSAFETWSKIQYDRVYASWRYFKSSYAGYFDYDFQYDNKYGRVWVEDENENIIAGMSLSEYTSELEIEHYRDEEYWIDHRHDLYGLRFT